jgi:hypothetical protein
MVGEPHPISEVGGLAPRAERAIRAIRVNVVSTGYRHACLRDKPFSVFLVAIGKGESTSPVVVAGWKLPPYGLTYTWTVNHGESRRVPYRIGMLV